MSDTIRIKLIEHGETYIDVERAEYEQAKADDELDQYLDTWASDIDTETVVIEPGGAEIWPFR